MSLEDGSFLMSPNKYDDLIANHGYTIGRIKHFPHLKENSFTKLIYILRFFLEADIRI